MTEYVTTREQCQALIRGVCSGCGGEIVPLETVDNARNPTFWAGCVKCSRFDQGVDERVFRTARSLVEQHRLIPYSFINEDAPGWLESQTHGAVSIVHDVLYAAKQFGLVGREPSP